ncbi:MAG: hypothetical protein HY611_03710 [Elusimicrobia bacterium]|nr:hypothetical protein [Elusimicrobiota bacterium]
MALALKADVILLDNMSPRGLRKAVRRIRAAAPSAALDTPLCGSNRPLPPARGRGPGGAGPFAELKDDGSTSGARRGAAASLRKGRVEIEASGSVSLKNVRRVAETGVDRISVGALTHSAPALDLSLNLIEQ